MELAEKELIQQGKQIIKEYKHNRLLAQQGSLTLNHQGTQLVQHAQRYIDSIDRIIDLITPERSQQVIILHGIQGQSAADLSTVLACGISQIYVAYRKGLIQLAQMYALTV
ncbi:hypothetical protein YK48G_17220 [Lentilactobacillus fungorum]|uniref:Uncharacterized protein n=1 Tax=Lentilactobacillus fungorum TaxID=2201250 RepID=A0ABQ3W1G9_9LACO|nr:hypothetical protein [Lentilactobacillus fungorum]GHP14297.1 hypothetical protein YK48G_17220 [Lentilactobacillus fungorum]